MEIKTATFKSIPTEDGKDYTYEVSVNGCEPTSGTTLHDTIASALSIAGIEATPGNINRARTLFTATKSIEAVIGAAELEPAPDNSKSKRKRKSVQTSGLQLNEGTGGSGMGAERQKLELDITQGFADGEAPKKPKTTKEELIGNLYTNDEGDVFRLVAVEPPTDWRFTLLTLGNGEFEFSLKEFKALIPLVPKRTPKRIK